MANPDIVIFGDFSAEGGIQRCLVNIIPAWLEAGYRVQLVGYRDAVRFYPDELPAAVELHHLGTRARLSTLWRLWRYLRRHRPRAVLATNHLDNLLIAVAGRLPGVRSRIVLEVQNNFVASTRGGERKRRRKVARVRRFYPWADAMITASQGLARSLREAAGLEGLPIHPIHNAVITPSILERAREPVDHPWFGDGAGPVAIYVGRFSHQKDLPTLLEALAEVRRQRPLRLIMVGKGSQEQALRARAAELGIADAVDMPGHVANPYAWMARADLFVLSSAWEGFGNVVAEALALGVPVVSTDCPSGPAEILEQGRYGRLVPVGDAPALAAAVLGTLDEPLTYDPAEAARRFTSAYVAERYLEVLLTDDRSGNPSQYRGPE
ncbi:MAG TPA: glycosyltransferase [Gammaproteobacteria bacterium]|nr:glycosyltransferase [Gammaproteobacteria bacterium]